MRVHPHPNAPAILSSALRCVARLLALCSMAAQPLVMAQSPASLDRASVEAISQSLSGIWINHPLLQQKQPPVVAILPKGAGLKVACPEAGDQDLPAAYCPGPHRVLIDPVRMADTLDHFRQGGMAFWLARGFGQAMLSAPSHGRVPSRLENLQATCLAGTLLGLLPSQPGTPLQRTLSQGLKATLADFDPDQAPSQGKAGQRAYAFLTGTGATRLSCSRTELTPLAAGEPQVPDQEILLQFSDRLRGPGVGFDQFCRKPPQPICPRPLPMGGAGLGI